ncbi:MAG: hypothetical protein RXS42_01385 [Nitrososphaeria archaeon]
MSESQGGRSTARGRIRASSRRAAGRPGLIAALTAATSVLPATFVYELFVGTISGRLPSAMAPAHLRGQELAFRIWWRR